MDAKKMTMLAVFSLLVAETAYAAAPLVTPGLPKGSAASILCGVVNAGTTDVSGVLLEIISESGATIQSATTTIPAGGTRSIASASSNPGLLSCRVTGIAKAKARVTFCTRDTSFNCLQSVTTP
jgi:hypothetical protein